MTLTAEITVGDVVVEDPAIAKVFEGLDIDYFCDGRRPLGDALRECGVSFDEFRRQRDRGAPHSQACPANGDWRTVPLRHLIRHIIAAHHAYLHSEMPTLERWAAQHQASHEVGLPGLLQVLQRLKQEIEVHIRKEETILFPAIADMEAAVASGRRPAALPFGTVSNFSRVLEREHRKCAAVLHEISVLAGNHPCPPDASEDLWTALQRLQTLVADAHYHIHLENNILFPRAIELEKGGRL